MEMRLTLNPEWAKKHPKRALRIQNIHAVVYQHPKEYPLKNECDLCPEDDIRTENLQHAHYDYYEPKTRREAAHNYITACPSCHRWMDKEGVFTFQPTRDT